VAFTTTSVGLELTDAAGAVVATLLPGGHPTAGPDLSPAMALPPVATETLRARLRAVTPLPAGLVAAGPGELVGRWGPATNPDSRGFIQFAADGSWVGSDGANDQGGRWSAAPDGEMVVLGGVQTLVLCGAPDSCADVASWFTAATRAALDGTTLVLLDAAGTVTGRAIREPPTP